MCSPVQVMARQLDFVEPNAVPARHGVEHRELWLEDRPDDLGPGLPSLPDGRLPEPESRGRRRLIRSFAVFGLLVSVGYLTWRTLWTIDFSAWFVALPLLFMEMHLEARVSRAVGGPWSGSELGLEFVAGQWSTIRDLSLVLFHGDPARRPPETLDLRAVAAEVDLAETS